MKLLPGISRLTSVVYIVFTFVSLLIEILIDLIFVYFDADSFFGDPEQLLQGLQQGHNQLRRDHVLNIIFRKR